MAIHNAHRERRDSLRAYPRLHQTRLLERDLTPIPILEAFPAGASVRPVTFRLEYEVTGADPNGIVLNVGDGDPATTVYYQDGILTAVSGSGAVPASSVTAMAVRQHEPGPSGEPARVRLVVAILPGNGHLRVWDQYGLLAQEEAAGGSIPAWSGESGSDLLTTYAAAAGYNDMIADPGAPVGFGPIEPSRGYAFYVPQHFLTQQGVDEVLFDEFLFRATYLNNQIALYPFLDDSV